MSRKAVPVLCGFYIYAIMLNGAVGYSNLPDRRTAWFGSLGISAAQQVTIMKREVHVSAQRGKMREGYQLYRNRAIMIPVK